MTPYCLVSMAAVPARISCVGPWPDRPRSALREPGCAAPTLESVFPSGRAAILACLELAGVRPDSVVGMPECVTGCLADAVRHRARPLPMRVALDTGVHLAATIVYEQWGWPLPAEAEAALSTRLAGVPVIVDRVDSADFFAAPRTWGELEVLSLSKGLGIQAGGLARRSLDGSLLTFARGCSSRPPPSAEHPRLVSHPAVRELFKQSNFVHPSASRWLAESCSVTALEAERQARSAAARLILGSAPGTGWPAWMAQAIEAGAGPVWAPVLRGMAPAVHRLAIERLERWPGIRAAVRMFNWTGDPLAPCYEPSIALPVHGGVEFPSEAIAVLTALLRGR